MKAAASLLIVIAMLSGCGAFVPDPTPDALPTEDEAIAFLNELTRSR
jgi:hypothetical protein